jgi:cell wall-associated NlpC family hydrolase
MSEEHLHSVRATSFPPALFFLTAIVLLAGCASTPLTPLPEPPPALARGANPADTRVSVIEVARSMLGVRYRYGGRAPEEGFDCSGLVVYSYQRAGVRGLPRSARDLERRATPVSLNALQPGDLLFFRSSGSKASHVAVYEGDRHFIHAPSSGKGVERVAFDHVYWGPRISRAGRLLP